MVKIPSGEFVQGYTNTPIPANLSNAAELFPNGDYDEQPYHTSRIQKSFYVSAFEVTNLEFEQFQPEHYSYRNTLNFSKNDDDAVLFVSWYDAVNYCKWLTKTYGEKNWDEIPFVDRDRMGMECTCKYDNFILDWKYNTK